jgi:hypothetical protein
MAPRSQLWEALQAYFAQASGAHFEPNDILNLFPMLGARLHRRSGRPHRRAKKRLALIARVSRQRNRRKAKGK